VRPSKVYRDVVKARSHRLQHLAPVGDTEQRVFLGIAKNSDHQFIEDLAAALDQVKMSVGRRIERSGIDGFDALHGALNRRNKIVCGRKRGWQSEGDGVG